MFGIDLAAKAMSTNSKTKNAAPITLGLPIISNLAGDSKAKPDYKWDNRNSLFCKRGLFYISQCLQLFVTYQSLRVGSLFIVHACVSFLSSNFFNLCIHNIFNILDDDDDDNVRGTYPYAFVSGVGGGLSYWDMVVDCRLLRFFVLFFMHIEEYNIKFSSTTDLVKSLPSKF